MIIMKRETYFPSNLNEYINPSDCELRLFHSDLWTGKYVKLTGKQPTLMVEARSARTLGPCSWVMCEKKWLEGREERSADSIHHFVFPSRTYWRVKICQDILKDNDHLACEMN